MNFFLCYEKRLHLAVVPLHTKSWRKYGWVVESGTLLTCWTERFQRFESSCFRKWWGSSVGLEQLSTKQQVVDSSPSLITKIAPWCNGKHVRFWIWRWWFESIWGNKVRSFGRLGVCAGLKILRTWFNSTRLHRRQPYGITAVQQVLALLAKVRLLLGQQKCFMV